jgi:hypothetical protein
MRLAQTWTTMLAGKSAAALDADLFFDGGSLAALPEKTGAMLKAAGPLRWLRARES